MDAKIEHPKTQAVLPFFEVASAVTLCHFHHNHQTM